MRRCVIVSAGPVTESEAAFIRPDDFIIACDAGWVNCERLRVSPDMIVGDFDSSAKPETAADITVLPHVKDDTDTHFAACRAKEMGFSEVLFLGALGGSRTEHAFANIGTAIHLSKNGIHAVLQNAFSRITFVTAGQTADYPKSGYSYFSVFPAEGTAGGVSITGSYYDVNGITLTADYPIGVSNEYAADSETIRVTAGKGTLMIVETVEDNRKENGV